MNEKDEIRHKVWNRLTENKLGRFPFPLVGRIPNFKGAEKAASYVQSMDIYKDAEVVKVNPDAPQLPLRASVLKDGKTLLIPTPRLKDGFVMIKPEWVPGGEERKAASIKHMNTYGKVVPLTDIPAIDLIVVGSVAIHRDGRRLGKGEGYADREYAILREIGNNPVPVITTINSEQLVRDDIPRDSYDLAVDWIITEEGITETHTPYPKPHGIEWEHVTEDEMGKMPILKELKGFSRGTDL
ncbi:5-formyltetrahydrofolate cyclo-ligase [Rossellomorea yichunensis]|uniref:5-formyltetrahydrofolate cyclo-ligase n=1 Tax=Rossellomorea yichunensis TaxID=3077331 RepID=UPI0028E084D5|nr:5-formyltetrahydrofolate cyclo-ligase [Rossellomorea sp. YC4-1]MDT9025965.1 5-formyltetrahydrofolate cyclo-ligase [Rossellomorea sp. YC4-1]